MPYANINKSSLYYEIHGDGFPLILIQGLGANIYWWGEGLINEISKFFKVIVFDNRGTGRGEAIDRDFTINDLAGDLAGLMDELDIQRAHVLGISMGGMIAQAFVLKYPERVDKLVLCSTNCGGSEAVHCVPEIMKILTRPRKGRSEEDIVQDLIPVIFSEDFVRKNPQLIHLIVKIFSKYPVPENIFKRQLNAIKGFNSCGMLKNISSATLILHGEKDILIPPQNGKILADKIPGARLKLFANSAHALFSQEPASVIATLIEFLQD